MDLGGDLQRGLTVLPPRPEHSGSPWVSRLCWWPARVFGHSGPIGTKSSHRLLRCRPRAASSVRPGAPCGCLLVPGFQLLEGLVTSVLLWVQLQSLAQLCGPLGVGGVRVAVTSSTALYLRAERSWRAGQRGHDLEQGGPGAKAPDASDGDAERLTWVSRGTCLGESGWGRPLSFCTSLLLFKRESPSWAALPRNH